MQITVDQVNRIAPPGWGSSARRSQSKEVIPSINKYMNPDEYDFGPEETVLFLGNCLWECGFFLYLTEGADGKAYEGSRVLGNTQPGDGPRFKGRGIIQVTGRKNYTDFSDYVGDPKIVTNPEIVAENFDYAALTGFWYWTTYYSRDTDRTCEDIALDESMTLEQRTYAISGVINWGKENPPKEPNHMAKRLSYTKKTAEVLGVKWTP